MRIRTTTAAETEAFGRDLGRLLRAGDVIALSGELGTGKTVLTRGIAAGAGTAGYVASPTFTLVREYPGPVSIYHIDLYRLDQPRQLDDLGLDEIFEQQAAIVIEWAEKAVALLPPEHLWVEIRFVNDDDRRDIHLTPSGSRYEALVGKLVISH